LARRLDFTTCRDIALRAFHMGWTNPTFPLTLIAFDGTNEKAERRKNQKPITH
jgi:hypothetical protein